MTLRVLTPRRFEDERGWFSETWNRNRLLDAGIDFDFCQDNQSLSRLAGTIRGLHFQAPPHAQTKLVRCIRGKVFDVVVDIRAASPTFGHWQGVELSAENGRQLLIPVGFAHGFVTLGPDCEVAYKVDAPYHAGSESGLAWNDPQVAIDWPLSFGPVLSDKDRSLPPLAALAITFPYDGTPLGPLHETTV